VEVIKPEKGVFHFVKWGKALIQKVVYFVRTEKERIYRFGEKGTGTVYRGKAEVSQLREMLSQIWREKRVTKRKRTQRGEVLQKNSSPNELGKKNRKGRNRGRREKSDVGKSRQREKGSGCLYACSNRHSTW